MEASGTITVILNLLLKLVLSGSMAMLWSMVNSLQITVAFALTDVKMPAPVYMLLKSLATISGFEIISPDYILAMIFTEGFTETQPVNSGWVAMDNESKVTILNLGSFFLIMLYFAAKMILYLFLYLPEPCCDSIKRVRKSIGQSLFWN